MTETEVLSALMTRLFGDSRYNSATPIAAGWSNRVLRVCHAAGPVIVRLPRFPEAYPIDRAREAAVWARAAEAGLAPHPLLLDQVSGVLVTPEVAVDNLADHLGGTAPSYAQLDALGTLLERFRRLPAQDLPASDPLGHIDTWLKVAARASLPLDPLVMEARARAPKTTARSSLAHQDLTPYNILAGTRLWLVDFELAGLGDPVLDLVTLATLLNLPPPAEARLFAAAQLEPPDSLHRHALGELVALREHAWAAAQIASGRDAPELQMQFANSLTMLKRGAADRQ